MAAKRPAPPGDPGAQVLNAGSAVGDRYLQAAGAVAASTPLHRSALVICFASIATWRFSAVSGVGWRMNDLTTVLPGVVKSLAVSPSFGATSGATRPSGMVRARFFGSAQSFSAAAPASLPSSLAFLKTSTYCLPSATLFRLAGSPSWPLRGGKP